MNTSYKTLAVTFGAFACGFLFVPNATAQCGGFVKPMVSHSSWNSQLGAARLVRAAYTTANDRDDRDNHDEGSGIVGFWHVKFISDGISEGVPGGVPKGVEVDAGYAQWHSDGTEIMNSGGRAPNTGDFCLGVWEKVAPNKYSLNHFAAAWDPTKGKADAAGNPTGEIVGPANIREEVTLAPNGESFAGTFTIDQYDESGNRLMHLEGNITGTRIGVNTPAQSIF